MNGARLPGATYRLQLNGDFTFADAKAIVPYLQTLGITHLYASPVLKARAGSAHGYDIVDHNAINPEIGDRQGLADLVDTLRRHGMGLILDIVPNHMGVGGDDNAWWLDVLEHGEASPYAAYFDIDWHPVHAPLRNKVLLPFLGDHYGMVLNRGELKLEFDPQSGAFRVRYYEHLFPIDPRTYPRILALRLDGSRHASEFDQEARTELNALIADLHSIPRRTELSVGRRSRRRQACTECRHRLAALCRRHPALITHISTAVERLNGTAGDPASFNLLHQLLEIQAYRLAYWLVASDEINYRRFFDVNELAGIRVEVPEVFDLTHRLLGDLVADDQVDGFRIDHPDGLSDPYGYYRNLQALIRERRAQTDPELREPGFLLVEKILASHERLREDWPVAGSTGYDAAYLLNGLFVYPKSERQLSQIYSRFAGRKLDFDELLYERKLLILRSALASELTVLANLVTAIATSRRETRDFTYHGLRTALGEVVASFPVYRTYITKDRISEEDRRYIRWAVTQARKRNPAIEGQIYEFLQELLILDGLDRYSSRLKRQVVQLCLRFQQYTAPVMAKGLEDTAFYVYNRLVSLNDVGFDPRSFGSSLHTFHRENAQRLAQWPGSMVTTSTHDSKRGEDVRVRINVISELPDEWRRHLIRWSRLNHDKKRLVDDARAPSRNDEYLLYQLLLGAWPLEPLADAHLGRFRERIEDSMIKAAREAKVHTSWINTNEDYENAIRHMVRTLLDDPNRNAFLADFIPFQRRVARFGLLSSLSQTLLKLTIPGIPDIYQGNELWAFNLVDPDNRRAVDYRRRQGLLQGLIDAARDHAARPALLQELLDRFEDGRAKLYLIWTTLNFRKAHPQLFRDGDYRELHTQGERSEHLCAFARRHGDQEIVVATGRWFARLAGDDEQGTGLDGAWEDTWIEAPTPGRPASYENLLTGEAVHSCPREDRHWFDARDLLRTWPVALLISRAPVRDGERPWPLPGHT